MSSLPRVVEARGLGKSYLPGTPFEVEVLKGVDLDVAAGEFLAITGQSGSGKSTLLHLLGALDRPTAGRILLEGEDLSELDGAGLARVRNRQVGFVFQFHHLMAEFTCLENVLVPIRLRGHGVSPEEHQRALDLLERVGLVDQLHKLPGQMSGGQQQRAAVVRALAHGPRLVLADEPTGNLDSRSGAAVFDLVREMAREQGVAFVMVTHDHGLARAADRDLRMEDGRLLGA